MHFLAPMTCIMLHAYRQVNACCAFFQISGAGLAAQATPIDWRATARKAWKLCDRLLPLVSTDRSAFE
jgi:hypothetical protein